MHTSISPRPITTFLALIVGFAFTPRFLFGENADFAAIARHAFTDTHAQNFRDGNIPGCVSIYASDAKFFVDNKLVASGEKELLEFYKQLREADEIRTIEIDEFVDVGSRENTGWAIFNYTKEYDLRNRGSVFLKSNKLEGFSTVKVKQYGTAIFVRSEGHWKIQTLTVFDPGIQDPRK
jgi:hypothetical protein